MRVRKYSIFQQPAQVFRQKWIEERGIIVVGDKVLVSLYKGDENHGHYTLCYTWFCAKVCKSTSHFELQKLPPTSAAARYHSPSCLLPYYGMEGESNHHAASRVGTAHGSWKESFNPNRATPSTTHTANNHSFLLQNI
jgi:hypothetical protein